MHPRLKPIAIFLFAAALGSPTTAHADCATPAGPAGKIVFNLTQNALEYCNGSAWIGFPKAAGSAPVYDWSAPTPGPQLDNPDTDTWWDNFARSVAVSASSEPPGRTLANLKPALPTSSTR